VKIEYSCYYFKLCKGRQNPAGVSCAERRDRGFLRMPVFLFPPSVRREGKVSSCTEIKIVLY
jgi:hypothetical protein